MSATGGCGFITNERPVRLFTDNCGPEETTTSVTPGLETYTSWKNKMPALMSR